MDNKSQPQSKAQPLIIAMKGHPGTGKSTLARAISTTFHLPLLDKDDIRNATLHLQSSPSNLPSNLLNELSYSALYHVARTQLSLGLSLVVDSPLSRRAHLDRMACMAGEFGARVVIVECRPRDEGEWRRRLEERGRMEGETRHGHKPGTWEELERLVEGYAGCWDYEVGDVERIVVDTTGDSEDVRTVVLDFVKDNLYSCITN